METNNASYRHRLSGAKQKIATALGRTIDLIVPPVCLGCERGVSEQGTLCPTCWQQMRFIEAPMCPVMGTPFTFDIGEGGLSAEAIANPPVFERARAVVLYDDRARMLVSGLKFSDRTELARWMAGWMVRAGAELIGDADVIVPVPLHRLRLFSRRFNQSAELARHIHGKAGMRAKELRYEPEVLIRTRATKQQVGLDATARRKNVQGAFRAHHELKSNIAGRRVLLVDDVYTTGATISAAARALLRGGASAVDCLTFARVAPGQDALNAS